MNHVQRRPLSWRVASLSLGLAASCASAPAATPDQIARMIRTAETGDAGCPQRHVISRDLPHGSVLTIGCGVLSWLKIDCNGNDCHATAVSENRLPQPQRLKTNSETSWGSPPTPSAVPTPQPDAGAKPVSIKTGKRLTDLSNPRDRPALPPELNQQGVSVWGLYKVCVDVSGQVFSVQVVRSALPGGFDGSWVANIENWKYDPYQVDGRPVPFCSPVRLQVSAAP
jgi:hypothetical protein